MKSIKYILSLLIVLPVMVVAGSIKVIPANASIQLMYSKIVYKYRNQSANYFSYIFAIAGPVAHPSNYPRGCYIPKPQLVIFGSQPLNPADASPYSCEGHTTTDPSGPDYMFFGCNKNQSTSYLLIKNNHEDGRYPICSS